MGANSPDQSKPLDVTICSVITPLHYRLMALNCQLVRRLNPGANIAWNIVNNLNYHVNQKRSKGFVATSTDFAALEDRQERKKAEAEFLKQEKLKHADEGKPEQYFPGMNLIRGVTLKEAAAYFERAYESDEAAKASTARIEKYLASYHHAAGLNEAMERVNTRYSIVLDPDFYVVRPNWISEVIQFMDQNNLALFGAPWHPRWYQKFRHFPCTHLMVVDHSLVPWRRDLLAPDLITPGSKFVSEFWREYSAAAPKASAMEKLKLIWENRKRALSEDMAQRKSIGASRDTGYRMIEEITRNRSLNVGCIQPVFDPKTESFQPFAVPRMQQIADIFFADERSYVPKKPGYFSRTGFRERGYPDMRALDWEEFLWRGEPFSFHVRGEAMRKPFGRVNILSVAKPLNAILGKLGRKPLAVPNPLIKKKKAAIALS